MVEVEDILGTKVGKLTVVGYAGKVGYNHMYYCNCECGTKNHKVYRYALLGVGRVMSCGCVRSPRIDPEDIVGTKIKNLKILSWSGVENKVHTYLCECDCGHTFKIRRHSIGVSNRCIECYRSQFRPKESFEVGDVFNHLTLNKILDAKTGEFRCSCGNVVTTGLGEVSLGYIKSCGCISTDDMNDIVGTRVGKLTITAYSHRGSKLHYYKCMCDCGSMVVLSRSTLITNNSQSCGCSRRTDLNDIVGTRTGKLIVKSYSHKKDITHWYNCLCDCGQTIKARRGPLKSKMKRSCGCILYKGGK